MRGQAVDLANIAEKKRRIMETGFRLFSEKGIESVSMPEIAAACGIPRASLYRYYATKTDLVIAIGAAQWMNYISAHSASMSREQTERITASAYFRWYMGEMGICPIYPKANLSKRNFKEAIVP